MAHCATVAPATGRPRALCTVPASIVFSRSIRMSTWSLSLSCPVQIPPAPIGRSSSFGKDQVEERIDRIIRARRSEIGELKATLAIANGFRDFNNWRGPSLHLEQPHGGSCQRRLVDVIHAASAKRDGLGLAAARLFLERARTSPKIVCVVAAGMASVRPRERNRQHDAGGSGRLGATSLRGTVQDA